MTNSKELFNELVNRVRLDESKAEIQSIIYLLLEEKLGLTRMEIMKGKEITPFIWEPFNEIIMRINQHEPIQYILGEAVFYGREFKVNRSVLIPRPETELLVHSVINEKAVAPNILDIGVGSGCIAITLSLEISSSSVFAIDISDDALIVAKQNAKKLHANVNFSRGDILHDVVFNQRFDFVVSNPPYIAKSEKEKMNSNVLDFEPHLALFVSDEDPLIFYKAIAKRGKLLLNDTGKIFVEINERFGSELIKMFKDEGYHNVRIEKDIDHKDRVLVAQNF